MGLIKLLNTSKQTLHLITQVKDFYIESDIETADKMIHFLVPKQDASYVDLKQENYLRTEDDDFVIKEINYKEKDYVEVFGKLDVEGLRSKILPTYESVRRPIALVMSDILVDTGWTYLPTDVPNISRTIRATDKTAHEIIMDCMNIYNLEVEFDSINKRVKVYQQLGEDRGSYIHSDLNLKKVEFQSDTYDFRTRLYAYGKDGLTFATINNGKEYVDNNSYSNKIVETIWRDDRYTDAASLLEDATARLEKIAKPRLSYVVDVIQLTTLNPIYTILDFKLGDTVKIMDKELELIDHQRVVKLTAYPITPEKNKVQLGDTQLKFKTEDNKVEEIVADKTAIIKTELMAEIDRVSELIGAPEKGFIITRKDENGRIYEQLIMNTDDVATASKVWRWNLNGLGYSSTGYNGSYKLAITSEGTINADFITVGNLNAALIKAGLLKSNDGSTWINMETGDFNFKDALVWNSSKNKLILGSNVVISWDYIADTPTIPTSAEDVGARPDDWIPTPTEVGARPDDWTPSASDVGAKPIDWVPTWNEVKNKPNIINADDIKTTIITKEWLGTLGLMVGKEIQMGSNAKISWSNVTSKPSIPQNAADVGAKPDDWVPTWSEIKAKPTILSANDIKTTVITKDWIGTLGLMVGSEIQMGSNAKISWANVTSKPTIPSQYTNAQALSAWANSGYATNITSNGLYTGTITANKLLIGGTNGSISFEDLSDKPWIPQNASDIGAKPSNWVPSWSEIKAKPTILSADDIKTTIITKDWIGTLGLMVGSEIQMGSNAKISWSNVESKPDLALKSDIPAGVTDQYITTIAKNAITTSTIRANQLLIGGANGVISFTDLSNKPTAEDIGARPDTWTPTAAQVGALPNTTVIPTTAADVGARPDTWTPTAAQVGARPNTWVPTATQVGARPSNWTPTAADVGARPIGWMPTATDVGAKPMDWLPSWNEVTGKPNIQPLPPFITSTKITATTIESPNISAGTIHSAAITGSTIGGGTIVGSLFKTGVTGQRIEIDGGGLRSIGSNEILDGISISPTEGFGRLSLHKHVAPYVSSKTYSKGERVTQVNGNVTSLYVYINNESSSYKPLTNTTYWRPVWSGTTANFTNLEGEVGEVVMNESPYHNPDQVALGIKSYSRNIHLLCEGARSTSGTKIPVSGDVQITSRHGKVQAAAREEIELKSSKDLILSTQFDMDYPNSSYSGQNVPPGHIIMRPNSKSTEGKGEVRIEGYTNSIIRSSSNSSSQDKNVDLTIKAGSAGTGFIYLKTSSVMSDGPFNHNSDIRLKENIKPIDERLLDVADDIDLISFNFKEKVKGTQIGVIAQHVESILDENKIDKDDFPVVLTTIDPNTEKEVKTVNYNTIMMLKIAALERRITELEG